MSIPIAVLWEPKNWRNFIDSCQDWPWNLKVENGLKRSQEETFVIWFVHDKEEEDETKEFWNNWNVTGKIRGREAVSDVFSRKLTIWEFFFTSLSEIKPSLLHVQHFVALRIILPMLLLKLMTQIFWVSLWIFVFWGLTNSPPSDVKVNLGRNPWIMVNFWVLKGQLWVLTCIPAVHFSAISVNFSRGWQFLIYRNSCVHPSIIENESKFYSILWCVFNIWKKKHIFKCNKY